MLFIGETVGNKKGPKVDIAVDPLEGTTLCAKNMPGAIATMAMADGGTPAQRPRRLYGEDRDRSRLSEGRGRSRRARRGEHPQPRQGQGRQALRDHRAGARSPAPCRHDRGRAQDRRRGAADHRRRRRRRHPYRRPRQLPASTSISASAARPRACWRRRRCAASAARCSAGWCSTPRRSASAPARWASPTRARTTRSRTWCAATACSPRPASPTAPCCAASSSARNVIETETVVMRSVTGTVRWIKAEHRQLESFISIERAMSAVVIRPVGADERAAWEPLWRGYLVSVAASRRHRYHPAATSPIGRAQAFALERLCRRKLCRPRSRPIYLVGQARRRQRYRQDAGVAEDEPPAFRA